MSKNAFTQGFQTGDSDGYISDINQVVPIGDSSALKNMGDHSIKSLLEYFWKVFTQTTQSIATQPPITGATAQMTDENGTDVLMRGSDNLSTVTNTAIALKNLQAKYALKRINRNFTDGGGAYTAPIKLPDPGSYNSNYDIVYLRGGNWYRLPMPTDFSTIVEGIVITVQQYNTSTSDCGITTDGRMWANEGSNGGLLLQGIDASLTFVFDGYNNLWRVLQTSGISINGGH